MKDLDEDECICVSTMNCRGFKEGKNIINFREMTDPNRECGSLLKTCCNREDVRWFFSSLCLIINYCLVTNFFF